MTSPIRGAGGNVEFLLHAASAPDGGGQGGAGDEPGGAAQARGHGAEVLDDLVERLITEATAAGGEVPETVGEGG